MNHYRTLLASDSSSKGREQNVGGDKKAIRMEVRQGLNIIASTINLYSKHIFEESFEVTSAGIKINDKLVSNIRYADDTIVVAISLPNLQQFVDVTAYKHTQNETYGFLEGANTSCPPYTSQDH